MTISIKVVSFLARGFFLLHVKVLFWEEDLGSSPFYLRGLQYNYRIKSPGVDWGENHASRNSRTRSRSGGAGDKGGSQEKTVASQKLRATVFRGGSSGQASQSGREVKDSEDWKRPAAFGDEEVVWQTAISVEGGPWKPDWSGLRSE